MEKEKRLVERTLAVVDLDVKKKKKTREKERET